MEEQDFPVFDPEPFDEWANRYDEQIQQEAGFPFEGYHALLDEIMRCADARPGMQILDLGTGTGELAGRFAEAGCQVTGTDFSPKMLLLARQKFPAVIFRFQDLRQPWPVDLNGRFDRIVSAYTLHHFTLQQKVELLGEMANRLLPGGLLIIGDLSFEDSKHLDEARLHYGEAWDEELYWVKSDVIPALEQAGFSAEYRQVSYCAGVYCIFRQNR